MSFEGNVPGAGGSGESAAYVTDGVVHVLNSDAVFKGDYANDSQDLVITAPDGSSVRVIDYFTFAFPPDVQAPNGSIVRGKDVVRLSGAAEDTRLAQAQDGGAQADGDLSLANAIGQVESFNGVARVTRADGTTVTLGNGDLVFQNDVVETASESSLSLTFVDGTIFSLSAGSRMVLDELVFDPGGSDNSAVFSLIEGGFVFIAGQVAPTGGMNVNTPSGVIGIRGTTVEVQILTVGGVAEVLVSLLLDPDGSLGEIELFDNSGTLVGTITDTETSWVLSTVDGETREITRAEANQLSEQALQSLVAQTFSAFGVATARVSAGGTFVSQDRVFGGGDPDDEEGLDADTLQDENAVPEDNGSDGNFEGDDGEGAPTDDAPAQDGEAVDENAAPEDSDASGAEDGETQDDSETQPDTEQPAIEEGSLQQEQENTLAAAGTGGVGGEAIPVAQSNAQSTGDAASDADGVFETGQLDPDKLEDAPLQNTVEDVQLDGSGVIQTGESTQLADGDANADGGLGSLGLAEGGEIVVGQSAGTVDESEPVQQQANVAPASLSFASSEPDPFGAGGTDPEDAFGFEGGAELGADPGLGGTSFGGDPQRTSFDAGEPELASAEPAQQSAQVFAQTFQDNDNDPAPEPAALPEQADPAPQPDPEPEPDIPVDPDPEPSEPPVLFDASFAFFADRLDRSGSVQADDAAGTPLTFSLLAGPENGDVELNDDTGAFEYSPDAGFLGTDSFTVIATNAAGQSSEPATISVLFAPTNTPPDAIDDIETTAEDTAIAISVLANDSDAEAGTLALTSVGIPQNGSAVAQQDGTVLYTPDADFNGSDSFTYSVEDGQGGSSTGTVTVTVLSVNDAPVAAADAGETSEDNGVAISVLANDSDPEGAILSISAVGAAANGSVAIGSEGTLIYTPDANFNGTDSFSYTVTDGSGGSAIGIVSITVNAVNDPPAPVDDPLTPGDPAFDVSFNTVFTIEPAELLANDVDVDGDSLSIVSVGNATGGTVVLTTGLIEFTPSSGFSGVASFDYDVSDGVGGTETASVTLNVLPNAPPLAANDFASTPEDTAVNVDVLANDSDPEGQALSVSDVSTPSNGLAAVQPDGTITYTPDINFVGADSFSYQVTDSDGGQSTATVTVTVTGLNDPPVAVADAATTAEDTSVNIDVLSNDTDPENTALSAVVVDPPSNGTVAAEPDGTFTYTPDANFNGSDGFTYQLSDRDGGFDIASVAITVTAVNDLPMAVDDAPTTQEDTPLTFDPLANDSDPDGDTISVTAVTQPANGAVVINPSGTLTYTPNVGFSGFDSFTYDVTDGPGAVVTADVTVNVGAVNDDPQPVADSATTPEDTPVNIDVLANDSDPDGNTLSVQSLTDPSSGTVVLETDGTVTYTPDANFSGTDSFTYTVEDGFGGNATNAVTVSVTAENDDPLAVGDTFSTQEDAAVNFDVLANDSDVENDILTVESVADATNGVVTLEANGSVTYTPDANFNGIDSFTYTVIDGQGGSATGTVNVTVIPLNDPPVVPGGRFGVLEDGIISGNLLAGASDADGDSLTVNSVAGDAGNVGATVAYSNGNDLDGLNGLLTINADGSFVFDTNGAYNALAAGGSSIFPAVSFAVSDGNGANVTSGVDFQIQGVNDDPSANSDVVTTAEDTSVNIDVLANDADPDGGTLIVSAVGDASNGLVNLENNGTITYTPNLNFGGPDGFTYTLTDGQGGTATGFVTVNVASDNDDPMVEDDTETTAEDTAVTIAVLDNDTDPDGDSLSVDSVGAASNGLVNIEVDGRITYTPDANFNGTDSFTYTAIDGQGGSATGTVSVTVTAVNDEPFAVDDSVTTSEDTNVTFDVRANDTDADGDFLGVSLGTPSSGIVDLEDDLSVTFIPDANFNGIATFTYTIEDDAGETSTALVTITVDPVADPVTLDPVTGDDFLDVGEQANSVTLTGVAEQNGSVRIVFGATEQTVLSGSDGSYLAEFGSEFIPDAAAVSILVQATDAFGNAGDSVSRTVNLEQTSDNVVITFAGSTSTGDPSLGPSELNTFEMPLEAIFVETSPGVFAERTPTIETATEVRYTSDSGRTFAFIGENLDLDTGIVTGFQIGTPTDPDFYSSTGQSTPVIEVDGLIAASIDGGTLNFEPFDTFFALLNKTFNGSGADDIISVDPLDPSANVFNGNDGDDTITTGAAASVIDGGDDFDRLSYAESDFAVTVNLNNQTGDRDSDLGLVRDQITNIEGIIGTRFNDDITLLDGAETNYVEGLDGADVLRGGSGSVNIVSYVNESRFTANTNGVVVSLAAGLATDLFGNQDTLVNFNGAFGTEFGDELTAAAGDSQLFGFGGNDILRTGAGNDIASAGEGADTVFYSAGFDLVQEFDSDEDALMFEGDAITFIDSLELIEDAFLGSVLFQFTDGSGENFGVRIEGITLQQAQSEITDMGLDGSIITVQPTDVAVSGTAGNDSFTVAAGGENIDRTFEASLGDDTYDFTASSFTVYNEITYENLGVDGIVANIDLRDQTGPDPVLSTVEKSGVGSDTLVNVQGSADWGFGIRGTSGNDTFNVVQNENDFSFLLLEANGGDDTVNYTGNGTDGFVRLVFGEGSGVTADLAASIASNDINDNDIVANNGDRLLLNLSGDNSETRFEFQTFDGVDTLRGTENRDRFILGPDDGLADGRGEFDIVRYDRSGLGNAATQEGVTVNLGTQTATGLWADRSFTHTLISIEEVRGSNLNDTLTDGDGDERLRGNDGNDTLISGEGRDRLYGGDGDDILDASRGAPETQGFENGDLIYPGLGSDTIIGNEALWNFGEGIDIGYENIEIRDAVSGDLLGLTFTLNDDLTGRIQSPDLQVDDTFTFANFFEGTAGDDVFDSYDLDRFAGFVGIGGADTFNGGTGDGDTVVYEFEQDFFNGQGDGIVVDVLAGTIIDTQGNTDTFSGIERIRGSVFNDTFDGSGDTTGISFYGREGNDFIRAGGGQTDFRLDEGNDIFEYTGGNHYIDDFNLAEDTLQFSDAVIANFGTLGVFEFSQGDGTFLEFTLLGETDSGLGLGFLSIEQAYDALAPTFASLSGSGVTITGDTGEQEIFGTPGDDMITVEGPPDSDRDVNASIGNDIYSFGPTAGQFFATFDYERIGSIGINANLDLRDGAVSTVQKGAGGAQGTDQIQNLFAMVDFGAQIITTRGDDTITLVMTVDENRDFFSINNEGGADTVTVTPARDTLTLEIGSGNRDVFADLAANDIRTLDGNASFDVTFTTDPAAAELRYDIRTRNGNDQAFGTDYDNRFVLQAGNDFADGRGGFDTIRYNSSSYTSGVNIDFRGAQGVATGFYQDLAFTHNFVNIERVDGSRFGDTAFGSDNDEEFDLRDGNDALNTGGGNNSADLGSGNDEIILGSGDNFVVLGSGLDTVEFSSGFDIVDDFVVGEDTLRLADAALANQSTISFNEFEDFDGVLNTAVNFADGVQLQLRGDTANAVQIIDSLNIAGDTINGTTGDDTFVGTPGDDTIDLGGASAFSGDVLEASLGNDTITFSGVDGENFADLDYRTLDGLGINATIDYGSDTGTIIKGPGGIGGTDTLTDPFSVANQGIAVSTSGGSNNYTITQPTGDFTWFAVNESEGGVSDVSFNGGNGLLRLALRDGFDVVGNFSGGVNGDLTANQGDLEAADGSRITLTIQSDVDTIYEYRTGDGDDNIVGSARNERFILGAGDDVADGVSGDDFVRYNRNGVGNSSTQEGVNVDLSTGIATGLWNDQAFNHQLFNIDTIVGSQFNDVLRSSFGGNDLFGVDGDDVLIVGALSNSIINGGDGGRDTALLGDLGNIDLTAVDVSNANDGFDMVSLEVLSTEDGAGDDTLTLSINEIFNIADTSDPLLDGFFGGSTSGPLISIYGDSGDTLALVDRSNFGDPVAGPPTTYDGRSFNVYEYSEGAGVLAIVAVEQEVTVTTA